MVSLRNPVARGRASSAPDDCPISGCPHRKATPPSIKVGPAPQALESRRPGPARNGLKRPLHVKTPGLWSDQNAPGQWSQRPLLGGGERAELAY